MTEEHAAYEATDIAAETMHGDLMSIVLDELKAAPDVWQRLGEVEQQEVIDRIKARTFAAINTCVALIAASHFTRLAAKVESVTVKDGIKAVLTLSQFDPARHELVDAQGETAYIVLADAEAFTGGAEAHEPDPDQAELTLGAIERIGKSTRPDDDAEAA